MGMDQSIPVFIVSSSAWALVISNTRSYYETLQLNRLSDLLPYFDFSQLVFVHDIKLLIIINIYSFSLYFLIIYELYINDL